MTESGDFHRFGPYLVLRTSGVGGMGRIDLALRADTDPSEVCVLKRLHAEEHTSEHEARFRREAKIAAGLAHDNIARTIRVEDIEGELCLAQEFVEGVNLGRMEKQCGSRGVPVEVAVHIVREVASALAYAHAFGGLGIVHRDIAPENVMLSFAGDVKLIDFGIAKWEVDATLTNVGMIVGRRSYIAPEAWKGAKVDSRADVYALGVVLWELLTGRRLEEMPEEVARGGVPDPRSVKPDVPEELAAVTMRALATDPVERYQKAEQLRAALDPFVAAGSDPRGALAALLGLWFNVDRAKQILAEDLVDAKRFLRPEDCGVAKGARSRRPIWIAAAAAAWVVLVGVAAFGLRSNSLASHATGERVASEAVHTMAAPPDADNLLRQASARWDARRVAEALALTKRAIAAGAGAPAHVLAGTIFMNTGKFDGAERELREAVKMNPADGEAKRLLALVRRTRVEQGE